MSKDDIVPLIEAWRESRQIGVLGKPRANVLRLHLMLDTVLPRNAAHRAQAAGVADKGTTRNE
ncbi:MAG: hypothetical protein ACOC9E_03460 [Chloroflexota bacterium]